MNLLNLDKITFRNKKSSERTIEEQYKEYLIRMKDNNWCIIEFKRFKQLMEIVKERERLK